MNASGNNGNGLQQVLSNFFTKAILYLTDGFLIAGAGLLAPIFAIFVEKLGGGVLEAGMAFAIFSFTAGIGIFIFSRFEDVHRRSFEKFVVLGYLLALIGYSNYLFLTSVAHLYLAQFILGLAAAIRVPSYDVLLSRNLPHHLAIAWGNWNAVVYIVSSTSALVGATIASVYGFKTLIILMFLMSAVSFIISTFLLKINKSENPHRVEGEQ